MIRFYAPNIESEGTLPEVESGHCCRVLRMKAGDTIYCVDGKGYSYECVITDPNSKSTYVDIVNKSEEPDTWPVRIVMAIAPTKNIDRIEWFLEKAIEMGVNEVVFLKCDRSERKHINLERLEKIAISAMKQSLKAKLPILRGLVNYEEFLSGVDTDLRYMGYCDKETERLEFVKDYVVGKDVTILIGPEGDFSPNEVCGALDHGFKPVTFGDSRLRTETAALMSLAAVHVLNQL